MEQKLREYRALRRRKELVENTKQKLEKTKKKFLSFLIPKFLSDMGNDKDKKEDEILLIEEEEDQLPTKDLPIQYVPDEATEVSELESFEEQNLESWRYFITKWTIYVMIWITGYIFFLTQGFGAVYFVISALVGIFLNTRTRRKKPGEISAYSVFNRNCESIDGTLTAEELQRQMLYGAGGLRLL